MDSQDQFEEFAKIYPELMEKCQTEYIGVGKGWYHLLDSLFESLSADITEAKRRLKYALEDSSGEDRNESIVLLEEKVEKEREKLPSIIQIKEKFGTLRVYVTSPSYEHSILIDFAESMSKHICEVCGSPAKIRSGYWIKTLCDKHHAENVAGEDIWGQENDE